MIHYAVGCLVLLFLSVQLVFSVKIVKLERKVVELRKAVHWVQEGVNKEEDYSLAFVGYVDDSIR